MFSVGTEKEAEKLLVMCCPKDYSGKEFVARELAAEQSLDNLQAFSDHLAQGHERLVESGQCECREL